MHPVGSATQASAEPAVIRASSNTWTTLAGSTATLVKMLRARLSMYRPPKKLTEAEARTPGIRRMDSVRDAGMRVRMPSRWCVTTRKTPRVVAGSGRSNARSRVMARQMTSTVSMTEATVSAVRPARRQAVFTARDNIRMAKAG
jgi:purine nucleoside permease